MFQYSAENKQKITNSLSGERLSTYLKAQNNDLEKTLELYIKNIEISAAFLVPLQGLEVSLRNSLNETIKDYYNTEDWFNKIPVNNGAQKIIDNAKKSVKRNQKTPQTSHVVAELPFGFWLALLNKEYHQTLWIPFLNKGFPHAGKPRSEIHGHLDHIRIFRNRIAHHEPIFNRHLEQDFKSIITALEWICPETAAWIEAHSKVLETLE